MNAPILVPWADGYRSVASWPKGVPFPAPITNGEVRFNFETRGLVKLEGIAVEKRDEGILVHGLRALTSPRESGYAHEGRVSVGGKRRRAFTSSQLFEVDGKLVDVGILYVCGVTP